MSDPFSSQDFDALLDDFISKQLADTEDLLTEIDASSSDSDNDENSSSDNKNDDDEEFHLSDLAEEPALFAKLADEEKRLYNAYSEFIKSVYKCAASHQIDIPEFYFSIEDLLPRFSPYRTEELKQDIATCWDIMIKAESSVLAKLHPNATDEQILDFAEKISIPDLQLSLISYVETLIEIDSCENAYNIRKAKYKKHKIEKELYEEQQRIINKKRQYAQAIRENNFPVDADLLVSNFFKTANKDPENAQKILTKNPATFAPIQIDKIPPRFFGILKAGAAEGKAANKKLGKFLTKLKI